MNFVIIRENLNIKPVILPKKIPAVIENVENIIVKIDAPIIRVMIGIIIILAAIPAVFSCFIWNMMIGNVIICAESVTAVVSAIIPGRLFNDRRYCL